LVVEIVVVVVVVVVVVGTKVVVIETRHKVHRDALHDTAEREREREM
jgi:hypothetical protein